MGYYNKMNDYPQPEFRLSPAFHEKYIKTTWREQFLANMNRIVLWQSLRTRVALPQGGWLMLRN